MPIDKTRAFFKHKDEMSYKEGLVFVQDRIVVPQKKQVDLVRRIHDGHRSVEKCLELARDTVFWPGITKQVKDKVLNCETYLKHGALQRHQPMQSHQPM